MKEYVCMKDTTGANGIEYKKGDRVSTKEMLEAEGLKPRFGLPVVLLMVSAVMLFVFFGCATMLGV